MSYTKGRQQAGHTPQGLRFAYSYQLPDGSQHQSGPPSVSAKPEDGLGSPILACGWQDNVMETGLYGDGYNMMASPGPEVQFPVGGAAYPQQGSGIPLRPPHLPSPTISSVLPASTPPGSTHDMSKSAPHLQSQVPLPTGSSPHAQLTQQAMGYAGMHNQNRHPGNSQAPPQFMTARQGNPPRMASRGNLVSVAPTNSGQHMQYTSQQMQMMQFQQVLQPTPVSHGQTQMFIQHMPGQYPPVQTRQAHISNSYYPGPPHSGQMMIPTQFQGPGPSFTPPQGPPPYFFPSQPGMAITRIAGGPSLPPQQPPPPPQQPQTKKPRSNAIKIINPNTGKDVLEELQSEGSSSTAATPPRSGESSAAATPPANHTPPPVENSVAAEFAAKVAKVAAEEDTGSNHSQYETLNRPPIPSESVEMVIPSELIQLPTSEEIVEDTSQSQSIARSISSDNSDYIESVPSNEAIAPTDHLVNCVKVEAVAKSEVLVPSSVPIQDTPVNVTYSAFPPVVERQPVEVPVQQQQAPEPVEVAQCVQDEPEQKLMEVKANGEIDGKATQRQRQKKGMKMRDINRRGAEKEGTDMDAFVQSAEEPPSTEAVPVPSPVPDPVVTQPPVPPLVPPPALTPPEVNSNMLQNASNIQELVADTEDELVAAKNEENTKVSTLDRKSEDKEPVPVIEASPPPPEKVQMVLKHKYENDQWSPVNPDGKKKYGRDFLLELMNDPQSKQKPDNLPDLEVVIKDSGSKPRMSESRSMGMGRGGNNFTDFTPTYVRSTPSKGPAGGRKSQQGRGKGQRTINVTLSLNEEVKLHKTEHAWKPVRQLHKDESEDQAKSEDLCRRVRGVLNKLTPQKFELLVDQVKALPIDTSDRLDKVINLVFEKAVDEPSFSVAYAQMCSVLRQMKVPLYPGAPEGECVNFRKLLIGRCQKEFEKDYSEEINKAVRYKEIEDAETEEKRKELQAILEDDERKLRRRAIGNIRFIGELYKRQMLTAKIMQECVTKLLRAGDEESLECLCKLLTTIGKELEVEMQSKKKMEKGPHVYIQDLSKYFSQMDDIVSKRQTSSRVRFMLQDVIELRHNNWVPRREDNNPKTIDQISKEAERESIEMTLARNAPPPMRRDDRDRDNRDRDRDRGKKGRGLVQSDDGWAMTTGRSSNRYSQIDTNRLIIQKPPIEMDSIQLGPPRTAGGSQWVRGSSLGTSKGIQESDIKTTSSNRFDALRDATAMQDTKRPPSRTQTPSGRDQRGLANKGFGSTSLNTDKERALKAAKQIGGEGVQPTSQQSSRDNSVTREEGRPTEQILKGPASMKLEEVEKKTKPLIDEYLHTLLMDEAVLNVQEVFSENTVSMFITVCIECVLERSQQSRLHIGDLMRQLFQKGMLTPSQYAEGLSKVLESAEDIAIDVPKFWLYIAEVIAPTFEEGTVPLSILKDASQPLLEPNLGGKFIAEVLKVICQRKGPKTVADSWTKSELKLSDFLSEGADVNAFISDQDLGFITGSSKSGSNATATPLPMDMIKNQLDVMLRKRPADDFDQIYDWIEAFVGERTKDPQFIRALITSVVESAITGSEPGSYKLDEEILKQCCKFLIRYLDHDESCELQSLYALQLLVNKLEHPKGMLTKIFDMLYDQEVISEDAFISWTKTTEPQEHEGRSVAILSVTPFLIWLNEAEEEEGGEGS